MSCFKSILLVACISIVGCSSSGGTGGGDAGGGNLTFSEFCGNLGETFGGQLSTCNGGPKDLWVKAFRSNFRCDDLSRTVDAGRAVYDSTFAQSCLTGAAAVSCSSLFDSAAVPDCTKTLSGKVAIGSTCYLGADCAENVYCAKATTSCSGTCKARIAAGAACATGDECVNNYSCVNSVCTIDAPSGTVDVGASCAGSARCKSGLVCDRVTKNCAKPVKEGQACVFGHGTCEFFTSCSSTNTCVRSAAAGGACGTKQAADGGSDFEYAGCLDSFCKVPTGMTAGTCVVLVADNGTCASGSECVSGTCTALKCAPRCAVP